MTETSTLPKNKVPSSITQVGITTKYTFIDYFRSRRFFILLTITLLIGALLTVLVGYYQPDSFLASELGFYSNWWGNSATYVIILSGIFFGGDAIVGEFQNKTGYFGLPNPIRRSSVYIGKMLAAFSASTAILGIFTLITVVNGVYYFGLSVPLEFAQSVLFAWFYLASVIGFTFFFSSLFKSSTMSTIVTAILFLFAFSLIQTLVSTLVGIEPWFILTYGAQIIGNVLTVPYPEHKVVTSFGGGGQAGVNVGFSLTTFNAQIPVGLAIIGIYFIVTAVLGLILFEIKEFSG
ncbi:MAG: ABC transporter permease [Candidatus Bathyarchaeota archaeon]|nr:ABC transporter permease [Candidatus Bathyarchaeum sp.]